MEFVKTDSKRYVQNVELLPSGELQWLCGRETPYFLILRTPLGYHPRFSLPEQQQWLEQYEPVLIAEGSITDEAQNITVTLLSAAEFFRCSARYKVTGGNVCYFVYAASVQGQTITCCALNNAGLDVEYCAENQTRATVSRKFVTETQKVGLFRKQQRQFLRVRIDTNDVLADGDLYYELAGYQYPVLRSMLRQDFYLEIAPGTDVAFCSRTGVQIAYKEE